MCFNVFLNIWSGSPFLLFHAWKYSNKKPKITEPRSNIAGKVSKERFEGNHFIANGQAVLLCPGQGFPIPKYE